MPISVIIADDHAVFCQGLALLLEASDEIELWGQAKDGLEALSLIESLRPEVAILDINMPQMTGIEVARALSSSRLETQVLLLTMHDNLAAVRDAESAGVAGFVLKDNTFDEVLTAVRILAAGGTFITPSIQKKLHELRRNGRLAPGITERERQVLRLIALGHSSKEAGRIMGISPRTVETYRNRLMTKLDLDGLAALVAYAVRAGMIP